MKINSAGYQIRQGFKNIHRNKLFSIASIATIAACIFLFGVFYSLVSNFQFMMDNAEKQIAVTVFFDEDTTEERVKEIGNEISSRSEVDRIEYTSPEQAWTEFQGQYFEGKEYLAEGFKDDNPLANSGSYSVYLNEAAAQEGLVTYIEGLEGVRQVNKNNEVAKNIATGARLVEYVAAAIIIILLAVAVFLITNTIVLGITVRKDEISIMKYVGATDSFVNAPFFVEGMVIGLIGSAIPLVVMFFLYKHIVSYILGHFSVMKGIFDFLPTMRVFAVLIPVSLILGLAIGALGSFFALRKHSNV